MQFPDERIKNMDVKELRQVLSEIDPTKFSEGVAAQKQPKKDQPLPSAVKFPFKVSEGQKIIEVACGLKHSLALTGALEMKFLWNLS